MKKNILALLIIIVIMLALSFEICMEMMDYHNSQNEQYDNALIIEDENSFREGINKSKGYAFAYGELKALDPVSIPELPGEYSYIRVEEQKYQKHTQTLMKTTFDANGTPTQKIVNDTYYSWDTVKTEKKYSKRISFLNVEFDYGQIPFSDCSEIKTIKIEKDFRIVYYGATAKEKGTLYTNMSNETIKDPVFYNNTTIEETKNKLGSGQEIMTFWIFWIITLLFIVVCVVIILITF